MDDEIRTCVQSIFGDNIKIVDCEKNASVLEEELVHINGIPVNLNSLDGDEANAIKLALLEGETPSVDILNKLLTEAGLLQQPMQLETTLSVKSSLTTKQHVNISKHGQLLDAHSSQTKEECVYQSQEKVIWQPPPPRHCALTAVAACEQLTAGNSSSTITTSTTTNSETSTTASQDSGSQLSNTNCDETAAGCSTNSLFNATYTSGQGLWQTNSASSAGLESTLTADDNISRLTADLSIDSGYPALEFSAKSTQQPTIVYKAGALVSGTIDALVALLVPRHNYVPDTSFSYTFLLSSRLFLPPQLVFEQMLQIWQSLEDLMQDSGCKAAESTKSVNNLLRLLLHWLNNFSSDLTNPKIVAQLQQELLPNLPNTDLKPSFLQSLNTVTKPKPVELHNSSLQLIKLKDICATSVALSQHLLQIELDCLSKIGAEELLLPKSPHIVLYKQWTQQLTLLVAEHLLQFTKKKQRVLILQYWLDAAEECFNYGNFNSLWGILHAFRLPAIARLKKMVDIFIFQ